MIIITVLRILFSRFLSGLFLFGVGIVTEDVNVSFSVMRLQILIPLKKRIPCPWQLVTAWVTDINIAASVHSTNYALLVFNVLEM